MITENLIKKFTWQKDQVTFQLQKGTLLINATEMAKPFNKKPDDFLRTQQTQDYITALCQFANMRSEDVVKVEVGGTNPGTWLHQKLALRFAQWLSPEFSLWVDSQIEKILMPKPKPAPKAIENKPIEISEDSSMLPIFFIKKYTQFNSIEYKVEYTKDNVYQSDLIQCQYLIGQAIADHFKR